MSRSRHTRKVPGLPDRPPGGRPGVGVVLLAGLLLAGGCNSLRLLAPLQDKNETKNEKEARQNLPAAPGKYSFRVAPYVFLADFEIKRDLPLFKELADLRDLVYKDLQLPPGNATIQVFLFEDRERYERFMQSRYPDLPRRRAFFVAQPRSIGGTEDLLVYTFWGERIQQDLRHELTHALLHSVLKEVPLWLDEGLAEYYELPPERKGVNGAHVESLRRGFRDVRPDLGRLEGLSQVQQMSPGEYREAWAWVHLLLCDKPEARTVLLSYLQQLRSNPSPGPLEPRLGGVYPSAEDALERHLARLDSASRGSASAQR